MTKRCRIERLLYIVSCPKTHKKMASSHVLMHHRACHVVPLCTVGLAGALPHHYSQSRWASPSRLRPGRQVGLFMDDEIDAKIAAREYPANLPRRSSNSVDSQKAATWKTWLSQCSWDSLPKERTTSGSDADTVGTTCASAARGSWSVRRGS